MRADPALFATYSVADRLGIGVETPLTCIGDMTEREFDNWSAYCVLAGHPMRLKESK